MIKSYLKLCAVVAVGPLLALAGHYYVSTGSYSEATFDSSAKVQKYGIPFTSREVVSTNLSGIQSESLDTQQIIILKTLMANTIIFSLLAVGLLEIYKAKKKNANTRH